jgi:GPI mannosyltransferase 3
MRSSTAAIADRLTLPALLLLALALRVWAAAQPGFHHPDALYQYLEPAHRLLTGDGVETWEWRAGMRGWLIPWIVAAPMALGRALAPDTGLDLLLPRLLAALASLAIVWSAWTIGARVSRAHALLAAAVVATWFEAVHFGAQVMAEPLACVALFPAAALATAPAPRRRALAAAGLLLGLTVLARPQYAPAALAIGLVPLWPRPAWRPLAALAAGAALALALGALADAAAGATPLAWVGAYVRENLLAGKAARFGVSPPWAYLGWWGVVWRWAAVPIALGLVAGRRRAPALLWAALAVLALHSLIGHKEYRFVLFPTLALVILAAFGWADWVKGAPRRAATIAVAAAAGSLLLGLTGAGAELALRGRAGSTLAAAVRADPDACGLAVAGADFAVAPARAGLRTDQALLAFLPEDPLARPDDPARFAAGYDRLLAPAGYRAPAGFARGACLPQVAGEPALCLFSRPGECRPTLFALAAVLRRAGR